MKNIAFIHINKTGGSSILEALKLPKVHLTAIEMRNLNKDNWDDMYKFTFVRNPWDKVVSHYHYRVETNQTDLNDSPISFKDWVIKSYRNRDSYYMDNERMFMAQTKWFCDEKGAPMVDFIGKFENLEADFQSICHELKVTRKLPHINRSSHQHYSEYYDATTLEIIGDVFLEDIRRFNYSFMRH